MPQQTTAQQPQTEATDWTIWVGGGYGDFQFHGTEAEAEETRARKANWERAVAIKYRNDLSTPKDVAAKARAEAFAAQV